MQGCHLPTDSPVHLVNSVGANQRLLVSTSYLSDDLLIKLWVSIPHKEGLLTPLKHSSLVEGGLLRASGGSPEEKHIQSE